MAGITQYAGISEYVGITPAQGVTSNSGVSDTSTIALAFGMSETLLSLAIGGIGTFTRSSTATVTDWEGIVRTAKSGEIRWAGWRRVANEITASTENLASWSNLVGGTGSTPIKTANYPSIAAPDGTFTATRLQLALNGGTTDADRSGIDGDGAVFGGTIILMTSLYARTTDGTTKQVIIRGNGSLTAYQITGSWRRIRGSQSSSDGGMQIVLRAAGTSGCSDSADILVWHPQTEIVSGATNTTPGEYVSVGVLGSPYHGANVDGVRYFNTSNANTIGSNNTIVESTGIPLHPTYYEPAVGATVWATYKPWAASESTLSLSSRRVPSQTLFPAGGNGYWYYVSAFVGASTGATEPTWPTTIGATVVDVTGNTWTNGGYYRIAGYLAEPQRTNLGRRGNDPTNATYWANVDSTPTLNSVRSPDGLTTSTLITEGSAGTAILAQSTKTVSAGSRQAIGVWLKRGNTNWVEVGMRNTGATNGFRCWVNLATGVVGTANTFGTATNEASYVEMQGLNGHWRVVLVGKLAADDTTAQPYVRSASADGTSTRVNGATYYMWRMQHVAGDTITSDIANDGDTDVTRSADVLSYAANSTLIAKGTIFMVASSDYARSSAILVAPRLVSFGTDGRVGIYSPGGLAYTFIHDSATESYITSGSSWASMHIAAGRWTDNTKRVFREGGAGAEGAFDGTFGVGAINLGSTDGIVISGYLKSILIQSSVPTDSALQAATQWHNL